jgi:hypothetical protein
MRTRNTAAIAALTFGAAIALTAAPAAAQGHFTRGGGAGGHATTSSRGSFRGGSFQGGRGGFARGGEGFRNGGFGFGFWGPGYWGPGYWGPGYWDDGYGWDYPDYGCVHWRWDPYWRRYVRVRGYC